MSRILLLEWSHKNLGSATSHLFFLICIGFRFTTELALKLLRLLSECSNFSSHPFLHLSSQSMYRRKHSALLQLCQYVFPHVKPPSQPPNHFHLLLQISGTHCQIICHPFHLFLLLEELSNIPYSCLLTLTVVRNLVRSNQLNVYHFVIHCQLLPSHSPEIPCRPSKGIPSERLRFHLSVERLQPPNHFHLLLQISGTHCQIICHPFHLFLLLEELSNIPYSCLLTLTVVRNLVRSNQLNVYHFVIHCQLLPSHSPEIPCRPSKGIPSERLRLVK